MVVQVWMTEDFTRQGEQERPDSWASHLLATDRHRVRIVGQMWNRLEPWVIDGAFDAQDEDQDNASEEDQYVEAGAGKFAAAGVVGSA
jgi:hypothetical protein